jgi:hypothetical protein
MTFPHLEISTTVLATTIIVISSLIMLLESGHADIPFFWHSTMNNDTAAGNFTPGLRANFSASSQGDLVFSRWGDKDNKLEIKEISNGTNPIFRIQGSTGNSSGGFVSQPIAYQNANITLSLGNITTYYSEYPRLIDNNTQVSFSFYVLRPDDQEAYVSYVVGPLYKKEGWDGNQYLTRIQPSSSYYVDLPEDHILTRISVGIVPTTTVDPVDFGIKLES